MRSGLKVASIFLGTVLCASGARALVSESQYSPGDVKYLPETTVLLRDAYPDAEAAFKVDAGERVRIVSVHESQPWVWVEVLHKLPKNKRQLSAQGWVPNVALEDKYWPPPYKELDLRNYEELNHLAKLNRYIVVGMDARMGVADIRAESGSLLGKYRSWGFLHIGAGKGWLINEKHLLIALEPFLTIHNEGLTANPRGQYSFSLGFMSRYLFTRNGDWSLGPLLGVLVNLSTFPIDEIPLQSGRHSFRVPVGGMVAHGLPANIGTIFYELFYEFGKYASFGLGLKVAVRF